MCGRYTLKLPLDEVAIELGLDRPEFEVEPRYNVAPTQRMPIVTAEGEPKLSLHRWGLIPFWAKDPSIGNKLLNARAETLHEKPAFRQAISQRRCLIPADGFYEWKSGPFGKVPHHIHLLNGGLITFGGLWESWKDAEGREIRSFTIITTRPNTMMSEIHDRMPVIIEPEDRKLWLSPDCDEATLQSLLEPQADGLLEAIPVSDLVNSTRNEGPELLGPPSRLF